MYRLFEQHLCLESERQEMHTPSHFAAQPYLWVRLKPDLTQHFLIHLAEAPIGQSSA